MTVTQRVIVLGLLCLAAMPGTAGDSLGRLFMTPEQRRTLDAGRESGSDVLTDAAGLATSVAPPADTPVVLNGVVRRSRGPDVVWVNGNRANARLGQPLRVHRGPDAGNRVTLENADGTLVRLKPGQFWDPATGRVADCSDCRAVRKVFDAVAAPPVNTPPAARP